MPLYVWPTGRSPGARAQDVIVTYIPGPPLGAFLPDHSGSTVRIYSSVPT